MKLSIITINRNNADGLRKTMESVLTQTYSDFEYIVVDGASTDGSVDVIKGYESTIKQSVHIDKPTIQLKWISEQDTGIYNAMNKGIEIAQGIRVVDAFNRSTLRGDKNKGNDEDAYVLMLNSGDYLVDEYVIERVIPELDGTDIVQGNILKMHMGNEVVCRGVGKSDITFLDAMHAHFLHQASFCRRDLFDRYGFFDESYRINGDTVFYAKCLAFGNATFRYVDLNIAYFDTTGISADPEGKWRQLRYEEDKRYMSMFSSRMQQLLLEEEKKIKLYNKLRTHKWSWTLTMAIVRLIDLFHNK